MNDHQVISKSGPSNERMIQLLNDELASEFQAIIAFIVYSQVIEKSGYAEIAKELERHAADDFQHVKQLAKQIESLGGIPLVTWLADNAMGESAPTRNVVRRSSHRRKVWRGHRKPVAYGVGFIGFPSGQNRISL